MEGVSAKLGVALESAVDLSRRNRVPEMAEYCEKVPHSSVRPHVDLVKDGPACALLMLTPDSEEHASGVWFPLTSVVRFITVLDL